MVDIKTQYAGLTLSSPLIVGSSGLTRNPEKNKEFEKAGAGAIVLKSLFEEQIELQSDSFADSSDYPEAADYIRGYVKANQINDYLELIRKTKEACTIPVIASIFCYKSAGTISEYIGLSNSRVSKVIAAVEDKKFIRCHISKEDSGILYF